MANVLQNVAISDDGIVKIISDFDGKKNSITCQLKDYVQYIASSFGSNATPVLPFGTRYYARKKDKICLVIEKPSFILPVLQTIYGSIENVPIPSTLWIYNINNTSDGLTTSRIYCYTMKKFDVFSLDMPLHHFIFPHYADWYGGVCWGDRANVVATISRDLNGFSRLPDLFFNTTTANHLIPADNILTPFMRVYSELSAEHKNEVSFDNAWARIYPVLKHANHRVDECLVPTGENVKTLVELILGEKNDG